MKVNVFLTMITLLLSMTIGLFAQTVNNTDELKNAIANAKGGQTITLSAGTFAIGNIALPDGVSLKGSGYKTTLIDAVGFDYGISSAKNASISDFALTSAGQVGILLSNTQNVTVERVIVRKSSTALLVSSSSSIKVQNFIGAYNYAGANFLDSSKINFVNNTLAYTESTSIRVNRCTESAFFNNLLSFSATGINTIEPNTNTVVDHNLYIASKLGKEAGDSALRRKVEGWATLTGYDKYSYTTDVKFADEENYDFRPVSKVAWAPIWATTSDKGMIALNNLNAPTTDIDGNARVGNTDIGAYEVSFDAPRKEDGTFTVKTGRVVSAGLFDENDKLVNYLFNNELLKPGQYKYWLPAVTFEGKAILPGKYKLKIVESNLDLKYVSSAGNGDSQMSKTYFGSPGHRVSLAPQSAIFNNTDNLIIGQEGFESGEFVRSYSDDLSHIIWSYAGGGHNLATAIDGDNNFYIVRQPGTIYRINSANGQDVLFSNGSVSVNYDETLKNIKGMAWLNGKIYVAANDAIVVLEDKDLKIEKTIYGQLASGIASDRENGRLYIISGGSLLVSTDSGANFTKVSLDTVTPTLITANNGRLAAYSYNTKKVYIYDMTDVNNVKELAVIGTGGNGYGKIMPERFWSPSYLALAKDGRVAVIDTPRTLVFDVNGKNLIMHGGMWGQAISYGFFDVDGGKARFFNINGGYDIVIDNKTNDWEYGTRWLYDVKDPNPIFFFSAEDRNFGIFRESTPGEGDGIAIKLMDTNSGIARTVARYMYRGGKLFYTEYGIGLIPVDGLIFDEKSFIPVLEANGEQVTTRLFDAYFYNTDTMRDGSIFMPTHTPVFIKMTGLKNGIPQYDIAGRKVVTLSNDDKNTFTSPYDFKTEESLNVRGDMGVNPDLSFVASIGMRSGAGPCPATEHAGSTDMAGYSTNGELRWVRAMNPVGMRLGMHGITNLKNITVAGRGMICEYEMFDANGLGLGTIGSPRDMGWRGMWIDNHRQLVGFVGNDDKPYIIVGDYASQSYHMMEITGIDGAQYEAFDIVIDEAKAAELKEIEYAPYSEYPVPPPPSIVVKKLDNDMEIDGNLDKWRAIATLEPLVISSENPANNSAVIRMGYTEKGIYVSVIKFDDTLVFHQTEPGKHYLQDGIEMNINTFWSAWKYNITRLDWSADICWRDRFFGTAMYLGKDVLPLNIQVFEDSDIPERKILEAASGADMSKCNMMIMEFLLTPEALEGANPAVVLESGKGFILGFSINDNDRIGADSFDGIISWPANYGAFSRENDLATVTFE